MKVKYIRRDIPEEISEDGGAFIQLVGKTTIGLTSSIKEAIRTLYCVGEASLIEGYFIGLVRSVFAGIKSDGAARCIGDIRFYPVCGGTFDLEKGWDPAVNDVRIKAQLVNGVELDISDWQFEDVTEGRVAFSVESVSDGTVTGQVSTNKNVQINGKNFPTDVAVSWACGTKSGDVAASMLTRSVSRLDIDKSAFSTLTAAEDGLPIVFTLKGSYNKATKSAVVKYVEPEPLAQTPDGLVKIMTMSQDGQSESFTPDATWDLTGQGLFESIPTGGVWKYKMASVKPNESLGITELNTPTFSADGKTISLPCPTLTGEVPAGTYPAASFKFYVQDAEGNEQILEIPIKLVVA